jgi:hypothetical protein
VNDKFSVKLEVFDDTTGREASAEGSHATLRPGQTRTDLGSESIGEKRFKGDTEEQYEVDKRKRDVRKRND